MNVSTLNTFSPLLRLIRSYNIKIKVYQLIGLKLEVILMNTADSGYLSKKFKDQKFLLHFYDLQIIGLNCLIPD